ncbi:MAG: hypothetical protein IJ068_05150 [Bacilli bacterium]|nr:hypothetical protein [Bacilli bacterium]
MKVIFLDIDGVLNYQSLFKNNNNIRLNYHRYLKDKKYDLIKKLIEIDFDKLYLLKEICEITKSYIVITSSWRMIDIFPQFVDYLIHFGLPVIDHTDYLGQRGLEIKSYLDKHPEISNYIIIDDDIFPDFDEEQLYHLIHTNFYNEGIDDDNYNDVIYKLNK